MWLWLGDNIVWCYLVFFFKQKTAYEMRISDWSSDVCSSDLTPGHGREIARHKPIQPAHILLQFGFRLADPQDGALSPQQFPCLVRPERTEPDFDVEPPQCGLV